MVLCLHSSVLNVRRWKINWLLSESLEFKFIYSAHTQLYMLKTFVTLWNVAQSVRSCPLANDHILHTIVLSFDWQWYFAKAVLLKVVNATLFLLKFLNSSLYSKEVNLQSSNINFLWVSSDTGGQEENVLGWSFVVNFDLSLNLEFEESNRLPEISVSVSVLLWVQPVIVILSLEVWKNLFGNIKPTKFIGCKDKSCLNWINLLQSLILGNDCHSFGQNIFSIGALESKVSFRIIWDVKISSFK